MTSAEALKEVRGYAAAGRYFVSGHALERMRARSVQEADLRHALTKATRCASAPPDRWKVTGPDLDGDDLTVVVVIDDGVLVVTVF